MTASLVYDGAYAGGRVVDDYVGVKAIAPSLQLVAPSGFGRVWSLAFTGGFFLDRRLSRGAARIRESFDANPAGSAAARRTAWAAYRRGVRSDDRAASRSTVAAPAVALAFVVQIALGALSRVVPRFGSFTLAFPLAFAAALVATAIAVPRRCAQRCARSAFARRSVSDASEKPFEATPHRIAKARREGNVARSSELGGKLVVCRWQHCASQPSSHRCVRRLRGCDRCGASGRVTPAGAAIAGRGAPAGRRRGVRRSAGEPVAERRPCRGFVPRCVEGRAARSGRGNQAHPLARDARALVAGRARVWHARRAAMVPIRRMERRGIAAAHRGSATSPRRRGWRRGEVAVAACAVGFCFAVAEYGAARSAWLRKLRMSFDERKREAKEEEGDPVARGRRRALHRALLAAGSRATQRRGLRRRQSDARRGRARVSASRRLRCRACSCAPPTRRRCAFARLPQTHGIPVVENVALARALYRDGARRRADSARALRRRRRGRRGACCALAELAR